MNRKAILALSIVVIMMLSSVSMIMPAVSAEDDEGLPSSFDQRDLGIVTPPKYQGQFGLCWAFAAVGAAETAILSMLGTTYEENGLDLSEKHAAYFSNNYIDGSVWIPGGSGGP